MGRLEAVTRIFTGINRQNPEPLFNPATGLLREITPTDVVALNKFSRMLYQRSTGDHSMQYIRGFEKTPDNDLLCHTDVSSEVWNSSLSIRVTRGCVAEEVLRRAQLLQSSQYIETVPVELDGYVSLVIKIKPGQKPSKDASLHPEINRKAIEFPPSS